MITALNLASLIHACSTIKGRKKIQKIVHLLQVAGYHDDFPYEFGYLHYGPYSHAVKHDLDVLIAEQLVQESSTFAGEHATFEYQPAQELGTALKKIGLHDPAWKPLARRLSEFTPQRLEAASTIAYLREKGYSEDDLRSRFQELKPGLMSEFQSAITLLQTFAA